MNDNPCTDSRYPLSALTGRIIAAAEEVPRTLGPGFRELVYQRASAKELPAHRLAHKREVEIDIFYKGKKVARRRVDFVIEDGSGDVMVEIKAKAALEGVDVVQALSYLKASGYGVGLLLNFESERLQIKRLANEPIVAKE